MVFVLNGFAFTLSRKYVQIVVWLLYGSLVHLPCSFSSFEVSFLRTVAYFYQFQITVGLRFCNLDMAKSARFS